VVICFCKAYIKAMVSVFFSVCGYADVPLFFVHIIKFPLFSSVFNVVLVHFCISASPLVFNMRLVRVVPHSLPTSSEGCSPTDALASLGGKKERKEQFHLDEG